MAELKPGRWFLPQTPDLIGQLRAQLAVTREGAEAFAHWARGQRDSASSVHAAEQEGDRVKRKLLETLRESFVTPIEPEDLFTLSRGIDWVLNGLGDLIREADALGASPGIELGEMAGRLSEALEHLDSALASLTDGRAATIAAADAAIATIRELRNVYYRALAASIELGSTHERVATRELYRRCLQVADLVSDIAERAVYATVKET